jgi:hypothetical protein
MREFMHGNSEHEGNKLQNNIKNHITYLIIAPAGRSFSIVNIDNSFPLDAAKSMPFDSIPRISAG